MNITKVVFCEEINDMPNPTGGAKVALINPTANFNLNYIPSSFSFSIMVMANGPIKENTNMEFKLNNPRTKKDVFIANTIIPPTPDIPGVPKEHTGLNLNLNLRNIAIEDEGEYVFECMVNGSLEFKEKLSINKRRNE